MNLTRRTMMRRAAQGAAATVLALGLGAVGLPGTVRAAASDGSAVVVWKAMGCECCEGWVRHMRAAGFEVTVHTVDDVTPMKRMAGVPDDLASCHTARVGGYVLEGHVPAEDVRRLLAERPQARGLAVPRHGYGERPALSGRAVRRHRRLPDLRPVLSFREAGMVAQDGLVRL